MTGEVDVLVPEMRHMIQSNYLRNPTLLKTELLLLPLFHMNFISTCICHFNHCFFQKLLDFRLDHFKIDQNTLKLVCMLGGFPFN